MHPAMTSYGRGRAAMCGTTPSHFLRLSDVYLSVFRCYLPSGSIRRLSSTPYKCIHAPRCRHTGARTRRLPSPHVTAALGAGSLTPEKQIGVVIVDHGSKKETSNLMLFDFVDLYRQVTGREIVEAAHMEIAEPTIAQAVERCISHGAQRVVIAPYFLSKGRHIQQDIPALVAQAQEMYPEIECVVADPIGVDPLMAQLIESRVAAAVVAAGAKK